MSKSEQAQDRWESCPPGTLARAVRGIQARRRDRWRAKTVGLAGGVVAVVIVVAMIVQQSAQSPAKIPNAGTITCATLQKLLPAFIAGKLEAAVAKQVETHLGGCPHCQERYKKAKDETALPGQPVSDTPQLAMRT